MKLDRFDQMRGCHGCSGIDASGTICIPNVVHQPWLGSATLRWEQLLSMLSVLLMVRPKRFYLYYDIAPAKSEQWACACTLASCVLKKSRRHIFGQPVSFPQHQSDLMRMDLLEKEGGIYVDHDSFVLRALDQVWHCSCPRRTAPRAPAQVKNRPVRV